MKAIKYWILVIVLTTLCITEFCAKNTVARETHSNSYNQWEYANYYVFSTGGITSYIWSDTERNISSTGGFAHDLWIKCGFKPKSKDVLIADWFNFLGEKGWELVCIKVSGGTAKSTHDESYWFKRPK